VGRHAGPEVGTLQSFHCGTAKVDHYRGRWDTCTVSADPVDPRAKSGDITAAVQRCGCGQAIRLLARRFKTTSGRMLFSCGYLPRAQEERAYERCPHTLITLVHACAHPSDFVSIDPGVSSPRSSMALGLVVEAGARSGVTARLADFRPEWTNNFDQGTRNRPC
jgi:hypothetical protein